MSIKGICISFFSSGSGSEPFFAILIEGHKKHFYGTILISDHLPTRRCRILLYLIFFIFNLCTGGHFVQRSGTILEILVEGPPRNISMILF